MKSIFLRHGESKANVWGGMYADDRMNFLSLRGAKQADLASYMINDLAPDGIDVVYTSDLTRARHTTSVVMQGVDDWQRDYEQDERLREWCWMAPGHGNWWDWEPENEFRVRIHEWFTEVLVPMWDYDITILVVSHYYTMEGLFDEIAIHQGRASDYTPLDIHGHVAIPNAIPFWFDTDANDEPTMILPGQRMIKR
jgi:broad specificity phosphatase PhoE